MNTPRTISIPAHTRRAPRKSEAYLAMHLRLEELVSESIGRQLCAELERAFAEDPAFEMRVKETM